MTKSKTIRVLLVDDHAALRAGLVTFIDIFDDLTLAGEATGGAEALELCDQTDPDVVLMDLVMPDLDGAETTRAITERYPHIQVIALTSFKEPERVEKVMQAGAMGYLLKDVSARELASAIRSAVAGQSTLASEAIQALVDSSIQSDTSTYGLTRRELEVLGLITRGHTNRQIAQQLVISRNTVKSHVSSILKKLAVSAREEAAQLALKRGLIASENFHLD